MAKKFGDKTISQWAREWGISRQAASLYFKQYGHLTIEEILEIRKFQYRKGLSVQNLYYKVKKELDPDKETVVSKWVRISGKQAKEWAKEWGVSDTWALKILREKYPNHEEFDIKSFTKKLDK
jgi:hypothetical protein